MPASNLVDVWGRALVQGGKIESYADVLERTAMGDPSRAISKSFYGINHRNNAASIPINKDYYGLTLFTKPDMRMTADNISRNRLFTPMLTARENTIPRAIRASLDWRYMDHGENSYPCSLIDPKQIFIPLLTNLCLSNSGWQDTELPTHTTEPGLYGEAFSYADGIAAIYRTYDITVNFRNIPGDPITAMFYWWVHYASNVFEGIISPYNNNLTENVVDYQTCIWRLILDPTKRWVTKIGRSGPAFPIGVPMGAHFNHEIDTPINRNDQIPIQFRCIGAEYQDPILVLDFNNTVVLGNADMDDSRRASSGLVKVNYNMINGFNYMGYPRIDPTTYELEWWVYNQDLIAMLGGDPGGVEEEMDMSQVDADGLGIVESSQPIEEYIDPQQVTR